MLRLLALMTLVTGGGLLFLMLGPHDGADAHLDPKRTGAVGGDRSAPRPPVGAPSAAVTPAAPLARQDKAAAAKVTAAAPTAAPSTNPGERNFLIRPTKPISAAAPPPALLEIGPPTEQTSPPPKTLVERAPTAPAVHELAPALRRLAAAGDPAPSARSSSNGTRFDLNAASAEELNQLGGGMIGKAIVRGRPYTSPEDLVRKGVLTRSAFAKVKGQVTAR